MAGRISAQSCSIQCLERHALAGPVPNTALSCISSQHHRLLQVVKAYASHQSGSSEQFQRASCSQRRTVLVGLTTALMTAPEARYGGVRPHPLALHIARSMHTVRMRACCVGCVLFVCVYYMRRTCVSSMHAVMGGCAWWPQGGGARGLAPNMHQPKPRCVPYVAACSVSLPAWHKGLASSQLSKAPCPGIGCADACYQCCEHCHRLPCKHRLACAWEAWPGQDAFFCTALMHALGACTPPHPTPGANPHVVHAAVLCATPPGTPL